MLDALACSTQVLPSFNAMFACLALGMFYVTWREASELFFQVDRFGLYNFFRLFLPAANEQISEEKQK